MAEKALELKWTTLLEMGEPLPEEKEIMIIGGGEIYKQVLPFANRIYLTQVKAKFSYADTFFPVWDHALWSESFHETHEVDDRHQYAFDFKILKKRKTKSHEWMGFQNLNSWTECIFVLNTMKIAVYAKSVRDPKHQVGFGELLMALSQRGHEIWLPPSLEDHVHMNIDSSMQFRVLIIFLWVVKMQTC